MSRRRCVACHIQEPGMIAIYQHPRGVDRIWTYVTGIIVKSKDQLCIPCYDELRVAHRFKEKCIHNNINRLGLLPKRPPVSHPPHDSATSDDSTIPAAPVAEPPPPPLPPPPPPPPPARPEELRMPPSEEAPLQVPPVYASELPSPAGARVELFIKTEPTPQEENGRRDDDDVAAPAEDCFPPPPSVVDGAGGVVDVQNQSGHDVANVDVVKMELELSLTDIGLRGEALSGGSSGSSSADDGERNGDVDDDDDDDDDDGDEDDEGEGEGGPIAKDVELQKLLAFNSSAVEPIGQPCGQCSQSFHSRAALKQHQQKEHKNRRHDTTNAVKYRRVLSGKINALMCRYCYREFGEADAKAAHEKTHLNDPKPFQCSYADCNRLFQHRSALNRHFYTHVTPKRFKCSVCPKRFHQHSSMVVHERQHRGDRPYICPQCGKGFTHVSNVKRHIRFHNGEKPYQCGKCPARFTTSTDLRRHMNSRRCMKGSIKAAK